MSSVIGAPRPFVPFLARLYAPLEPYAYTLIRLAVGAIFIPHGVHKLFYGGAVSSVAGKAFAAWALPAPLAWTYGLGVLELAGGVMLALGLLTRPIALLFVIELAVFIFGVHIDKGWLWNRGGVQYPLFLLGMCMAMLIGGGGPHSLDRRIGREFSMVSALGRLRERAAPLGYAFARVFFALLILPSGYEKVFEGGAARIAAGNITKVLGWNQPVAWAWAVSSLEFFGMILLALGLFTRPVAFAFAIQMAVIAFLIQMPNGYFWTSRGSEFALVLMLVCIAFVIGGGGRYSLDRRIGREF